MSESEHPGPWRHAFTDRLTQMGYHLDAEQVNRAFARFKDLADKKKIVSDADLAALVAGKSEDTP